MAKKTGRPFTTWRDWEGRQGTVYQMCVWHDCGRSSLYKRRIVRADGIVYLPAPKGPRTWPKAA
jgi:hypothetical protein